MPRRLPDLAAVVVGRLVAKASKLGTNLTSILTSSLGVGLDLDALGDRMMASIDDLSSARWEAAVERAAALPGELRPDKVRALTASFSRELAMAGAAAGAAAAAPAVGTTASLLAAMSELAWFTGRSGDLVLTIAALHGRPTPTVDERRAWVLAVLLYGGSAQQGFTEAADQLGIHLDQQTPTRLPVASIRAINGVLTKALVRRYGARRGVIAVGRAIPLGIGAAIGGSANWSAVRALARNADSFFAKLPYSAVDTTATEVGGLIGS